MSVTLRARRVLTGEGLLSPGFVTMDGALLTAVTPEPPARGGWTDLGDHDLLPGLVDLHADGWQARERPRPTARFGWDETLAALDTEAVSWGITTQFLCVTVQDDTGRDRTLAQAERTVDAVTGASGLRADHRVHLRVEVTGERLDVVAALAAREGVGLLSAMDHTPGQGQFRHEADWRAHYAATGEPDLDALLARRRARQPFTADVRAALARIAREHGLPLASHDDDSPERVEQARQLGARIAEFPVTAQAAEAAAASGLLTVMGAPNAVRGTSHVAGNLSARATLTAGHLGALASDYHAPSLLGAVYALAAAGVCDLPTAVALATRAPAGAAGLTDRGVLAPGARADLVAVGHRVAGRPTVAQTWVGGVPAFAAWHPA
ncbi:alpha-D-ribose 1-methylphosphonate 5-triphosphate diphosphatase [Streptomyces avicenniae]|uniref:alpha-D-ribose 1-methylphosphonate 5-triphosphate diphosphatase n=1 Tax=Streptomyces avicenniae TaxID=500153 RepID=UPI00069997CE|nr:alpha-D-ribose 1-methylphosphonate 5-triphosphate diphosphatase [Streptomyces avicenniae]